ncbi:hypothetical protein ACJIZ3_017133 [Penstemon smallii]|uniref:Uncharacterized protein n=1 Tax=Penstemon smallii TaxID=265156 RepID=A0ABD3SVA8_9LAMI
MAESKNQELEKQGKKKAKIENLEGGSSSLPSIEGGGYMSDGGIDEDGGGGVEDPLVVFGSGVMMIILSKMDARSVALSRLVSRGWLAVASTDRIWAPKKFRMYTTSHHFMAYKSQPLLAVLGHISKFERGNMGVGALSMDSNPKIICSVLDIPGTASTLTPKDYLISGLYRFQYD